MATRRVLTLVVFVAVQHGFVLADTIYQTTPQGREAVVHRNAILVKEDSSSLLVKHFELKERRVVKVRLNKASLPYRVEGSGAADRQQIVDTWKHFGHKATVTDQEGKVTKVFDAYLDFYPPGGRGSLLESVPARTALPLELAGGGFDEVEFSKIDRVELGADRIKLTLRDGRVVEGRLLKLTDQPVETRFLGITDRYDPASEEVFDFSVPLARLKEIRFE